MLLVANLDGALVNCSLFISYRISFIKFNKDTRWHIEGNAKGNARVSVSKWYQYQTNINI